MSSKQQCDPKTTDCIEKEEKVRSIAVSVKKPTHPSPGPMGSAGNQPPPMSWKSPSWRGGRKKRRRKSRKKKRKSRRKTRKKRRRKSRKKRKTRRRKKGGVKQSAFNKTTLKKSQTSSNLAALLARSKKIAKKSKPQHASHITRQGFKQPRKSSLSKHVTFRPISPQSQPPLMQQPSQGSVVHQPQSQQEFHHAFQNMSINPPSPTSSEDELSSYQNP